MIVFSPRSSILSSACYLVFSAYCCFVVCLSVSKTDAVDLLRTFIKQLYDLRMSSRTGQARTLSLPELYVDNFDNEQIFQQLEMFNSHVVEEHRGAIKATGMRSANGKVKSSSLDKPLSKHVTDDSRSGEKQVRFESHDVADLDADEEEEVEASDVDSEDESALQKLLDNMNGKRTSVLNDDVDDDIENDEADDDDDDDDNEDSEAKLNSDSSDDTADDRTASSSQHRKTLKRKNQTQISAVDDRFFKLAEMEAFLDEQDAKEQRQHSRNADDSEDDDDYDLSADDKVIPVLQY